MWQAALTFWGVIVGGVIAGGVALWQAQLATQREREARQVERAQAREDTHAAFQRDAILSLHEAVTRYWELILDEWNIYHPSTGREENEERYQPGAISTSLNAAYARMLTARAKVFDDELRRLVSKLDEQAGMVSDHASHEAAQKGLVDGIHLLTLIEARVNALLRELF